MRVYDFNGTVAAVVGPDHLHGSVVSAGTFGGDFDGDILSDDSLDGVVQPRDGSVQEVAMELWIDGEKIDDRWLIADLAVDRDYDNVVQGWQFANPLLTPEGLLGTPFTCFGPGIGLKRVDIYGVYKTATGVHRIKLLPDGYVDNSTRESGENGIFEVFEGVDRGGRYDGVKMTKQFPPGHGLYRGRVGREVMRSIGETQTNFEDGNRMDKELQLVDALPIPTLAEVFETENRKILWDSEGFSSNPRVGPIRADESAAFSFEERDILRVATVRQNAPQNVITLVIANGTRQKTLPDCGLTYDVTTEYTFASPYTYFRSLYLQNVDGTYTSLTPNDPTDTPVLTKKVETTKVYRCEQLIDEIVKTWELRRREVPRHKWEGGDGTDPELQDGWRNLLVYTDDADGVGGGPAYSDDTETLYLVSVSRTNNFFLHQDYVVSVFDPNPNVWYSKMNLPPAVPYATAAYVAANPGADSAPNYGQAQGSVTFFSKFGHIPGSIKTRTFAGYPTTPWNEVEPDADYEIWGDGGGVNVINSAPTINDMKFIVPEEAESPSAYDVLMPWSISANVYFGDAKNFKYREDSYQWEWRAKRGTPYYFGENDSRGTESLRMQLADSVITTYAANKNQHSETISTTDIITGKNVTIVKDGLANHLPAIARLDSVPISTQIYEDGEAEELAQNTRRGDTEQVVVTVPFDFFLTCHLPNEVTVDFPWAENEDELRKMAEAMAQESSAQAVFFTLPAHFLLREAMPIHLLYRPLAIDHDIRVKRLRWSYQPDQPILTEVECRLYPAQ